MVLDEEACIGDLGDGTAAVGRDTVRRDGTKVGSGGGDSSP